MANVKVMLLAFNALWVSLKAIGITFKAIFVSYGGRNQILTVFLEADCNFFISVHRYRAVI